VHILLIEDDLESARLLVKGLSKELRNFTVTVSPIPNPRRVEGVRATITGEVRQPSVLSVDNTSLIEALQEVGGPISAIALRLVAVFVPLAFIDDGQSITVHRNRVKSEPSAETPKAQPKSTAKPKTKRPAKPLSRNGKAEALASEGLASDEQEAREQLEDMGE